MGWSIIGFLLVLACARPRAPSGGPADETPPSLLSVQPADSTTGLLASTKFRFLFDEKIERTFVRRAVRFYPNVRYDFEVDGRGLEITLRDSLPPDTTITVVLGEKLQDLKGRDNSLPAELWFVYSTGADLRSASIFGRIVRKGKPESQAVVEWQGIEVDSLPDPSRRYPMAACDADGLFQMHGLPADQPFRLVAYWDQNDNLQRDEREVVTAFSDTLRLAPQESRRGLQWSLIDPDEPSDVDGIAVHQVDLAGDFIVAFRRLRDGSGQLITAGPDSAASDSAAAADSAAARAFLAGPTAERLGGLPLEPRQSTRWNPAYENLRRFRPGDWKLAIVGPRGNYRLRLQPGTHRMIAFIDASGDSMPGAYLRADSTAWAWEPLWWGREWEVPPGEELKPPTIEIR